MNNPEIEKSLEKLGRATQPRRSMVWGVMERIEQLPSIKQQRKYGLIRFGRVYRAAAVFAAVAACIGALFFALHVERSPKPRTPIVGYRDTIPTDQNEDSIPRLIDYQRALNESPQALEALLQRRTSEPYSGDERSIRVADGMRSDLYLN